MLARLKLCSHITFKRTKVIDITTPSVPIAVNTTIQLEELGTATTPTQTPNITTVATIVPASIQPMDRATTTTVSKITNSAPPSCSDGYILHGWPPHVAGRAEQRMLACADTCEWTFESEFCYKCICTTSGESASTLTTHSGIAYAHPNVTDSTLSVATLPVITSSLRPVIIEAGGRHPS